MEEFRGKFKSDFLNTVQELEKFSSSDGALKEAMWQIKDRIGAERYRCVPQFWADLRETLEDIERHKAGATKAQQVLKQILRLEVTFYVKEATEDLRATDPEQRLSYMASWLDGFANSESRDLGKDVIVKVLSDLDLQKDMEPFQREQLSAAVERNRHKFPSQMQRNLDFISLQPGAIVTKVASDWRRRQQVAAQAQDLPPSVPLLPFLLSQKIAAPGEEGDANAEAPAMDAAAVSAQPGGAVGLADGLVYSEAMAEEEEEVMRSLPNSAEVQEAILEQTRETVMRLLRLNSDGVQKQQVRALLEQAGIPDLPFRELGEEVFFFPSEVFLRRPDAKLPKATVAPQGKQPVPQDLREEIVGLVREANGRLSFAQLEKRLQWRPGSQRHEKHGKLEKALGQVRELFYEPHKVYSIEAAQTKLACFAPEVEEPAPVLEPQPSEVAASVPYVGDVFAVLLNTVRFWLQQAQGVLTQKAVVPLIKALGFKARAVIAALANEVFWSHPEAECDLLLRTKGGIAQHPSPLSENFLDDMVHRELLERLKKMGAKAKVDALAGQLRWNSKSERRRAYGTLFQVLRGLREVFYDPEHLYSKQVLVGLVEWPSKAHQPEDPALQQWSPEVEDKKSADSSDPFWLNAKRQLIGTVMLYGGRCPVAVLQQLLQGLPRALAVAASSDADAAENELQFEELFRSGSRHDLSSVLCWPRDRVWVYRAGLQPERPGTEQEASEAARRLLAEEPRRLLREFVKRRGSASLPELQEALGGLDLGMEVSLELLTEAIPHIQELFFHPEFVFLRHVVDTLVLLQPQVVGELILDGDASEGVAAVALGANTAARSSAADPRQEEEEARDDGLEEPGEDSGQMYYTFNDFRPGHERPDSRPASASEQPASKRRRADEAGEAWVDEFTHAPPWATQGAAVKVRSEQDEDASLEGVITLVRGTSCTVRFVRRGQGSPATVERELASRDLMPVKPVVGATVRILVGEKAGCQGELIAHLGAAEGVVRIAMSFETVRINHLVVLAA